ncbi:MAG: hypothetical protein ACI4M5_03550 [Christensenellales bacterium]
MLPAQNPRTPCLTRIYTVRKTTEGGGRVVSRHICYVMPCP